MLINAHAPKPLHNLRIGNIQRAIVVYLYRCGSRGGYLGRGTIATKELQGFDIEQIERSLHSLSPKETRPLESREELGCTSRTMWYRLM